jgi:UDP-3-O-acyl N-acetylglucosamine deacetylase
LIKLSHRRQRSIARPSGRIAGVGFITATDVTLRFRPAPADTGIVFLRTDLPGSPRVLADVGMVSGTARRTTLGMAPRSVTLVEHVLSALAGLRIDNCFVELDACEPPGLDGSACGFVEALLEAGVAPQEARKPVWTVEEPIILREGGATLGLHPELGDDLVISYLLDFGTNSPIDRQTHTQRVTPGEFVTEIAPCRTFLLEREAHKFREQGIGTRTTYRDLLVFGPGGPIENSLRYANEPARHKILDLIGDLALSGLDVRGHIVAYRSGHQLNTQFARTLAEKFTPANVRPTVGSFRRAA